MDGPTKEDLEAQAEARVRAWAIRDLKYQRQLRSITRKAAK